ncbi:hypothetical protein LR48_Vigan01g046700 [Vigna angularis]|uniref:Peptidase C1A papain C-terminal domain-containing protein n=1 Tax=Phaseolus angularis TaxID=3914 RepID=A0A0L9TKE1_PHAAN|nr:hypothetical protein LR48_Vigan01g046700 [Vigna angularis]
MYLQDPKDVYVNMANKKMKKEKFSCDDAPASWDWRKKGVITEVKNQGHCGSGWAFSATGAIEATNAIVTGNLVSVSEQEIIDCVYKASGCEGGYHFHAFEWVIENGGIATKVDYPYTAENGPCRANLHCCAPPLSNQLVRPWTEGISFSTPTAYVMEEIVQVHRDKPLCFNCGLWLSGWCRLLDREKFMGNGWLHLDSKKWREFVG